MKKTFTVSPGETIEHGGIKITAIKGGTIKQGDAAPVHKMVFEVEDGQPGPGSEEKPGGEE